MNIPINIFREYDIRGIYGQEITDEVAYIIGKGYGTLVKRSGNEEVVLGHDNRLSSEAIYKAVIKGILETGINVIGIGLCTTPMIYFARETITKSGMMITASHNPSEYNGFKFSVETVNNVFGEYIQDFFKLLNSGIFEIGEGELIEIDIRQKYLDMLKDKITLGPRKIRVVLDCGNGTGSIVAESALENIGAEVLPIYCDSDGTFPNHNPDPTVEENVQELKQKVLEVGADLGIGIDGDADRLGIIDEKGNIIHADKYMIIIWRDIIDKVKNKNAVFDVKCSKSLEDELLKLGAMPQFYKTGNSYMKDKLIKDNLDFAGEYSGHVFFKDEFYGFDDGIYAAMRLIRILSNTDKTVSELLDGINNYFSTQEIITRTSDDRKEEIVEKIKKYCIEKGYKILEIDGIRVIFEDGWVLVRKSNTGPNITSRFEAKTEERLNALQEEFIPLIK